jgi:hypothetical protein
MSTAQHTNETAAQLALAKHDLHTRATSYADKHGLPYEVALGIVGRLDLQAALDARRGEPNTQAEKFAAEKRDLHTRATSYADKHGMDYATALERLAADKHGGATVITFAALAPAMHFEADADTLLKTRVELFRAGKYEPQGEYSAADVQTLARTYDPAWEEAPVTLDHEQAGPALGWVKRLYAEGATLFGDLEFTPAGKAMLDAKAVKRRSIEIWKGFQKRDGTKAPLYLKAVSLLGAMSPAVKGMANVFNAQVQP